jgi:rhodanese-related sulfurtransferase
MNRRCAAFLALVLTAGSTLSAAEVEIVSLSRDGVLTWTNAFLCVTCRVERAHSIEGPWEAASADLAAIRVESPMAQRTVDLSQAAPAFFRVGSTAARSAWITNVTAAAALVLVTNRATDSTFTILDVRTPSEYATRHIKGATNLNYYGTTFNAEVAKLSRCRAYLVYCASGNRSSQATSVLRAQGFLEVYNMSSGFGTFSQLPDAGPWLEP